MIILAITVYAAFVEGVSVAWWMFLLAAMFDLAFIDEVGEAYHGE